MLPFLVIIHYYSETCMQLVLLYLSHVRQFDISKINWRDYLKLGQVTKLCVTKKERFYSHAFGMWDDDFSCVVFSSQNGLNLWCS